MYYSLFGSRGLLLGARARLSHQPIEVLIEMRSIRHPVSLRLRTTDVALCRDILLNGQYDCELSRPPRAIIDAGANIGLSAIFYANKYPEAKIIAIEPEQSNFRMLQKNCAGYPRIFPVHAALWRESVAVRIRDCGAGHHAFQTSDNENLGCVPDAHIVSGITVEKVMEDFGIEFIDLLKMDIEGAERDVFANSSSWIGKVGVIAVELHDWIRSGCSDSVRSAAIDFEALQKGETTYLTRKEYRAIPSRRYQSTNDTEYTVSSAGPSRFPFKIVRTP
jgi:FkbM family methyltransferase